jgi:hypothetical protein
MMVTAGVVGGVFIAGIVVALVLPLGPDGLRNPPVVWGISAVVVGLSIGGALLASRPSRE